LKRLRWFASACSFAITLGCSQPNPTNSITIHAIHTDASRGSLEWQVDLRADALRVTTDTNGSRVVGENLFPIAQPGEPDVVAASALFAVPLGWDFTATLTSSAPAEIRTADISPYEICYRCAVKDPITAPQLAAYRNQSAFPQTLVSVEKVGESEGQQLLRLALFPANYSPKDRLLSRHPRIEVRLRAYGTSAPAAVSSSFLATVANTSIRPKAPLPRKLVVVVADRFAEDPVLKAWVDWKNEAGFFVETALVSEVGRSTQSIRNYLERTTSSGDFVLLVGDERDLPTHYENVGWQIAASDYPFARHSSTNPFPSRFLGRVTASTVAQLRTQFTRFMNSEKAATDTLWHDRASTIASSEGFSPSDVQYAQSIEKVLFNEGFSTVDRFYEAMRTANPASIRSALEQGRTWLSYFGHGSGTAWTSTNGNFTTGDVQALDNRGKLPFIVDVACDNGAWTRLESSFSESWMNHEIQGEPAGSVGYFGGSVKVSWHEPAVMAVGIADYRFRRQAALMGQAVFAGQIYMLEKLGLTRLTLNNLVSYNLFGDPSLLLRTKSTQDWTLGATLQDGELVVKAETLQGLALQGMFLGVSSEGRALYRTEFDGNKEVRWTIPVSVSTTVRITAYGNGWQTKQVDFPL
jgi:hypothetical protein